MSGTPLLDVNVLIALFDPAHPHHEAAHEWFGANRKRGWATCPITQNGFIRVLTNPAYPTVSATTVEVVQGLQTLCASPDHEFWPDQASLLDDKSFRPALIGGSKKITDVYLLGLAVQMGGKLATFDRSISIKAVVGAQASHLRLLGGRAANR